MSAYALPGLFPPLPKRYDYATTNNSDPSDAGLANGTLDPPLFQSRLDEDENVKEEAKPSSTLSLSFLECEEEEDDDASSVDISVKEAKIDSALLVQRLANSTASDSCGVATHSPRSSRRRKRVVTMVNEPETEDEAMKFELSVSFGGRNYTTTRSWPSICQFRKDLIRNVRSIEIPELPSLHPPGVLCRSFSFLHNLVSSYVPTLEGWLQTVAKLVPHDNEILSHFLYESELELSASNQVLVKELEKRSSCSQLLDAIEESESEEEDDDDDDDDEEDESDSE